MAAFQWAGRRSSPEIVNIGPLALIAPLLDRLDLAAIIDRHLPADPQLEYSPGAVLTLLLAARLSKPTALVNVADWASRTGAELLWNIPAHKLNDDRLGRALDLFFEQRHSIQASATMHALRLAQLSLERIHFDPTHVLFEGAYASSQPRPDDFSPAAAIPPAHITYSYQSKEQKAVQVANAAIVDELGAVPIFSHVLSGNQNGQSAMHEHFQLLHQHLPLPDQLLLVSDRGTFSAGHALRLAEHGYQVLCSANWRDYRALYDSHMSQLQWADASYLSIEQQRRRHTNSSLPREHYRLAVLHHTLRDADTDATLPCRVIFVYSSSAAAACRRTRRRSLERARVGLDKIAAAVRRGHPRTRLDQIPVRVDKLLRNQTVARHVHWELQALTPAEQAALPPPGHGACRPTHRFVYHIDEAAAEADTRYDGLSVLVTTAPLSNSADSLFTKFKEQNYVELGHHQYKTPLAVAPVFLKSPRRVEALTCLLQIALQVYQMLERLYRQSVPADAPNQEKRMTAERLLRAFEVHGFITRNTPIGRITHPTPLTSQQQRILDQLHLPTPEALLHKRLPNAPNPYAHFPPPESVAQGCGI
jgi:uncharacterized protein DUF4277